MFSVWLQERCLAIDVAGVEDFRRLLARYGVERSTSTISYWLTAERVPERQVFAGILDALGVVQEPERALATRLWLEAERPSLPSSPVV